MDLTDHAPCAPFQDWPREKQANDVAELRLSLLPDDHDEIGVIVHLGCGETTGDGAVIDDDHSP